MTRSILYKISFQVHHFVFMTSYQPFTKKHSSLITQWIYITYLAHICMENINVTECYLLEKIRYNNFIDQILLCVWPQVDDISIHVNTKINLSIKRHFRSLNSCRKSSSSNHNEKDTHTNMEVQEWIPRSNIYFTVNIWVEILWTP